MKDDLTTSSSFSSWQAASINACKMHGEWTVATWQPFSLKFGDSGNKTILFPYTISHRIHVWYIYLHLVDSYGFHVGKYTSPMDPMGYTIWVAFRIPGLHGDYGWTQKRTKIFDNQPYILHCVHIFHCVQTFHGFLIFQSMWLFFQQLPLEKNPTIPTIFLWRIPFPPE